MKIKLKINKEDIKKQIIILSFISYLIYGYGIYVMEKLYTPLYLLYVIIVSLSFWTLIYSFINIKKNKFEKIHLNKVIRYLTISFLIFVPILFYSIWISELIPLIQEGLKLEFMFSVYILDMVFILPAFLILAVFNYIGLDFKKVAYLGIITSIVAFIAVALIPLIGLTYFWWWMLFNVWFVLIGWKLYILGKG